MLTNHTNLKFDGYLGSKMDPCEDI